MITHCAGREDFDVGKGGRVMIASQNRRQRRQIDTPDGQVILAAGEKVYLQASTDPALRGLLVEVDAGGEAWNRMTGEHQRRARQRDHGRARRQPAGPGVGHQHRVRQRLDPIAGARHRARRPEAINIPCSRRPAVASSSSAQAARPR